jgi:hypothetical protein
MTQMRTPVPPIVLIGRITAILGMSFALAISLLMLMAGVLWVAGVAFLAFFPFFWLLHWIERFAKPAASQQPASGAQRGAEPESD